MKDQIAILSACLFTAPAFAHHNAAAHYLVDQSMTIEGVVTEFRAINPHARIYFEAKSEAGETETWMAEGDSFVNLRRLGWTVDQLKPGDRIQIVGHPSRNGAKLVEWTAIEVADGAELGGGNGQIEERLRYLEQRLAEYRAQVADSAR